MHPPGPGRPGQQPCTVQQQHRRAMLLRRPRAANVNHGMWCGCTRFRWRSGGARQLACCVNPAPPAAAAAAPSCPRRLRATHAYLRIERAAVATRGESSGALFVDTRVHTLTLCSNSRRAQIGCPASAEHQRAADVAGARKDGGKRGGVPLTGLPARAQAAAPASLVRQEVQAHALAAGPRSNRASIRKARL